MDISDDLEPTPFSGMFLGTFVTFEGCEGSGKTTQAKMLYEHLIEMGRDALLVREPGGTPIGERIREILLDDGTLSVSPITEALLFAAARAQQVRDVLEPALRDGDVVIGDRYVDSSLAYQGVGRGCGLEAVKNLNDWATGGLEPNITVFLDLPVEDGISRVEGRELDRIEREGLQFHINVRDAYSMLQKLYSHRYAVINAAGTPDEVHERVFREVKKIL